MVPEPVEGGVKPGWLRVEVVYALREEQTLIVLELEEGAAVRDAVERSGLQQRYPALKLGQAGVGIFGKLVELTTLLRDGDRVEIYHPLLSDPKQARRERAERRKRVRRA